MSNSHKIKLLVYLSLLSAFATACDELPQTATKGSQPLLEGGEPDSTINDGQTNDFSTQTGNAMNPSLKAALLTINDSAVVNPDPIVISEMLEKDIIGCETLVTGQEGQIRPENFGFIIEREIHVKNSYEAYYYEDEVSWGEIVQDFSTRNIEEVSIYCEARLLSQVGDLIGAMISEVIEFVQRLDPSDNPLSGTHGGEQSFEFFR